MRDLSLRYDDPEATGFFVSRVRTPDARVALPDATGANVINWSSVLERYARRPKKYPIWSATIDGQPLEVTVHSDGTLWFAENDTYNVAGHGESVSLALADALDGIRYLAGELLNERDEALSDHARELKQRYARLHLA
jgi:hypothetical protein